MDGWMDGWMGIAVRWWRDRGGQEDASHQEVVVGWKPGQDGSGWINTEK